MHSYGISSIALSLCLLINQISASNVPTATIDSGAVIGTTTSFPSSSTGVNKFLGIPFGAPPERFTPPKEPEPWSRPLEVKATKPACIQKFSYPEEVRQLTMFLFNDPAPEESEDCLYLNVFAPAAPYVGKGRAVLFWIYGGGLEFGHAGIPFYDGSYLAAQEDIIVVSANYRTNVFGFPSSSELPVQERNLGFLDQRLALDWVQRNIHAFGGDPDKITLFGESAGAFSIDALLTSHGRNTTPPFRAAILQSGQLSYRGNRVPGRPYVDSTPDWKKLVSSLNCSDSASHIECVRAAPATTLKSIIEHQPLIFNPVYDNRTLVTNPDQTRKSGNIAPIPILSGTTRDEGRILVIGQSNLTAYLDATFGARLTPSLLSAITGAYPIGGKEFPTAYDAIAAIETDLSFRCPDALVTADSAAAGIPTWRYVFDGVFPNTQQVNNTGAYHSSEIKIVFGTYERGNATVGQETLSAFMRGAWARFARDPVQGPGWNRVGTGAKFLGGAEDLDVGVLGGGEVGGVRVVSRGEVDGRCGVWRDVLTGAI